MTETPRNNLPLRKTHPRQNEHGQQRQARFHRMATVIDCHTKAVIGWATDDNYKTPLIERAVEMAARNYLLAGNATFTPTAVAITHRASSRRH